MRGLVILPPHFWLTLRFARAAALWSEPRRQVEGITAKNLFCDRQRVCAAPGAAFDQQTRRTKTDLQNLCYHRFCRNRGDPMLCFGPRYMGHQPRTGRLTDEIGGCGSRDTGYQHDPLTSRGPERRCFGLHRAPRRGLGRVSPRSRGRWCTGLAVSGW